jgi:hypothetical protein
MDAELIGGYLTKEANRSRPRQTLSEAGDENERKVRQMVMDGRVPS